MFIEGEYRLKLKLTIILGRDDYKYYRLLSILMGISCRLNSRDRLIVNFNPEINSSNNY